MAALLTLDSVWTVFCMRLIDSHSVINKRKDRRKKVYERRKGVGGKQHCSCVSEIIFQSNKKGWLKSVLHVHLQRTSPYVGLTVNVLVFLEFAENRIRTSKVNHTTVHVRIICYKNITSRSGSENISKIFISSKFYQFS